MSRLFLSLLLLLSAAPGAAFGQPAAPAAPAEAQVRPLHVIPFDLYDNRIYLDVAGPGFSGRRFLLDSGAQITHFTAELVAQAGLRTGGASASPAPAARA